MSEPSIQEYTVKMRERYSRMTERKAKSKLLDEFVKITGWDRKHANKVILGIKRKSGPKGKRGAPKIYGNSLIEVLKKCWLCMDQPCGKRRERHATYLG